MKEFEKLREIALAASNMELPTMQRKLALSKLAGVFLDPQTVLLMIDALKVLEGIASEGFWGHCNSVAELVEILDEHTTDSRAALETLRKHLAERGRDE